MNMILSEILRQARELRAGGPGSGRKSEGGIPFKSTNAVMIKRSGYPLWLEKPTEHPDGGGKYTGRVAMITHPDHELGDMVDFHKSEVKDVD